MDSVVLIYLNMIMLGLPLIVTNGYYNITETKSIYFFVISLLLTVCGVISFSTKTLKGTRIDYKLSYPDIAVLLFAFITFLSAIFSEYSSDVWIGEASRYQGAIVVIVYALVYFVVSHNYDFSSSFIIFSLTAFSLVSVVGVLNCFNIDILGFYGSLAQKYKEAYISTIGNVNFFSGYMCLLFPVVVCGFCQTEGKMSQIIYMLSLVFGSFGMMVTSSESFVIGLFVSMLIIPLFCFCDTEKLKRFIISIIVIVASAQLCRIVYKNSDVKNIEISELLSFITEPLIAVPAILLCLALYLLILKAPHRANALKKIYIVLLLILLVSGAGCFALSNTVGLGSLDKIFRITDDWGTYRGEIWKQCAEIYKAFSLKDKLLGIGPEALYRVVKASEIHGARTLDQAHNEYLQYLLTTGLLGLLSYLSIIITVTVSVIKRLKGNALAVGLLAGLISYWVQASVNIAQPFTTPIMYIFIACIGGMLYNEGKKSLEIPPEKVFKINQNSRRKL